MKIRQLLFMALAALFTLGSLAGCGATPTPAPADTGNAQMANPWKDATAAEAAQALGGTFYNFTTLDSAYKQYALLLTTDDAVKNGTKPSAMARYNKGDEDVTLTLIKGAALDAEQLKGAQTDLKGAMAYILQKDDGTSHIAWEASGLLYEISASTAWSDGDLVMLAQGVKAVS